jgi:curved DNA-binding protein CbpA
VTEERDPYRTLGIPFDASDDDIRKAYYARARRAHPDVVGESGLDDMRALNEAWSLLKDAEKRTAYDTAHGLTGRTTAGEAGSGDGGSGSSSGSGGGRNFGSQPHWTGAAGPPPGRPWGTVLTSGIYAGWSLGEVARRDRGYLAWLRDRPEGKRLRTEIERLLELGAPETPPSKPGSTGRRHR